MSTFSYSTIKKSLKPDIFFAQAISERAAQFFAHENSLKKLSRKLSFCDFQFFAHENNIKNMSIYLSIIPPLENMYRHALQRNKHFEFHLFGIFEIARGNVAA